MCFWEQCRHLRSLQERCFRGTLSIPTLARLSESVFHGECFSKEFRNLIPFSSQQLNMYGFSKVMHLQQGVLKTEPSDQSEMLEFRNEHFQRDQPDLLCLIHRKKSAGPGQHGGTDERALTAPTSSSAGDPGAAPGMALDLRTVLSDIAAIRKHQTSISAELKDLSASNKQLWTEALASRERYQRHQDTINKIVRFLGTVFGGKIVEASELGGAGASPDQGQAATDQPESSASNASSPDLGTEASAGTAAAGHRQPGGSGRNRKRLLIKGPEEEPGSAQITEIEVPNEDDMQQLPNMSAEDIDGEGASSTSNPRSNPSLHPSVFQQAQASTSKSGSFFPSPLSSPSQLVPFTSSANLPDGLQSFDPSQQQQQLPSEFFPFMQPSQGGTGFTPPPTFAGPSEDHNNSLQKSARDYNALTSQMDHLQTALDRLVSHLPPDQVAQLNNRSSSNSPSPPQANAATLGQAQDGFDLDQFLQQFAQQEGQTNNDGPQASGSGGDDLNEWFLPEPTGQQQRDVSSYFDLPEEQAPETWKPPSPPSIQFPPTEAQVEEVHEASSPPPQEPASPPPSASHVEESRQRGKKRAPAPPSRQSARKRVKS